ncbi:MAG: OmpP1/FadL family transporter [Pseudomonadales bacterium]
MKPTFSRRLSPLVTAILLASSSSVFAAGYQLKEQSAEGQGNSFAGQTAKAYDASTVFFNPAGMSRLERDQIQGNLTYIAPTADYLHGSFSGANTPFSETNQDGGVSAFVPASYGVWKLNEKMHFGFAINAPFGLSTEYDRDWVGANANVKSEITTINLAPSLSYKVTPKFSVGASLQIEKAEGELTREVTTGLNTSTPSILQADDIGFGYTLGALYQYSDKGRIGFNYRSQVKHDLEGTVNIVGVAKFDASTDLTLPAVASVGIFHEVGERWELLADISWTGWSSFDKLVIEENSPQSVADIEFFWSDTIFTSIGANYKYSDDLKLKFGIAYDQSAANDKYRTAGIPDADRIWASVGASYDLSKDATVHFGYSHIFGKGAKVSDSRTSAALPVSYSGNFDSSVDILSLGIDYKF